MHEEKERKTNYETSGQLSRMINDCVSKKVLLCVIGGEESQSAPFYHLVKKVWLVVEPGKPHRRLQTLRLYFVGNGKSYIVS